MDSGADTAKAVGCPIRKSPDQSLLAAPRSLSQRATSFIASQCQGIHQMPFRRLILICGSRHAQGQARSRHLSAVQDALTFRPLLSKRPEVRPRSLTCLLHAVHDPARRPRDGELGRLIGQRPIKPTLPCCGSFRRIVEWPSTASTPEGLWWRQTGSNRRPPACKAGALPTELCPQFVQDVSLDGWWAREDLNLRPHAYQARALTN